MDHNELQHRQKSKGTLSPNSIADPSETAPSARVPRRRLALVLLNAPDLSGGGGTERRFGSLYDHYQRTHATRYDCYFVTDERSLARLQATGRLFDERRVICMPSFSGRSKIFRALMMTLHLVRILLRRRIDVAHFCLPRLVYLPALALLCRLPHKFRPQLTMGIVNCSMAHLLTDQHLAQCSADVRRHRLLFKSVTFDGIFTWYRLFKQVTSSTSILRGDPVVYVAATSFADLDRPRRPLHRERLVVFAARMIPQKRPLMFVDAVWRARQLADLHGWRFAMYGQGPLEADVQHQIRRRDLGDVLHLTHSANMCSVFARSAVFVSTQDFENYPSLSMLEAMIHGNAIVARAVGDTEVFVKDGENGLLATEDTSEGIAKALVTILNAPDRLRTLGQASMHRAARVHTIDNFVTGIEGFWDSVLRKRGLPG